MLTSILVGCLVLVLDVVVDVDVDDVVVLAVDVNVGSMASWRTLGSDQTWETLRRSICKKIIQKFFNNFDQLW